MTFKVGDKVRCMNVSKTVRGVSLNKNYMYLKDHTRLWLCSRFELMEKRPARMEVGKSYTQNQFNYKYKCISYCEKSDKFIIKNINNGSYYLNSGFLLTDGGKELYTEIKDLSNNYMYGDLNG